MHALSQTLAHRGPSASRARTRWQPYSSTLAATTTPIRSPSNYLNTPASPVPPSPPSASASSSCLSQSCHLERPRKPSVTQPCQITGQSREAQKNRYVSRLVDQAVNSLCDIWHPDDIPIVFRTSSRTAFSGPTPGDIPPSQPLHLQTPFLQHSRNIQLPSPVSPSTQASPFCPILPTSGSTSYPTARGSTDQGTSRSNQLLPLKGFVHEVLRRSRTSTGVLQTALCYLEAVRGKIPDIRWKENTKATSSGEEQLEDRIIVATEADTSTASCEADLHQFFAAQEPLTAPPSYPLPTMDTTSPGATYTSSTLKRPSPPLPPLPPLPSPLLCPRRTFLACLILASKFMQDRSYSNRAWAKLAGLPPREISRCERALGEALEWRLWVGKGSNGPANGKKTLARSRSEGDVLPVGSSTRVPGVSAGSIGIKRHATAPVAASWEAPSAHASYFGFGLPQVVVDEPEDMQGSTYSRSLPGDATELIQDRSEMSPSLLTPTLSYSPMSSTSSNSDDGERTIQMSGFLDLPLPGMGSHTFDYSAGQKHLKSGLYGSGYSTATSNVMILDSSLIPPIVNPAAMSSGPMSLPPLYETLAGLSSGFTHGISHGIVQMQAGHFNNGVAYPTSSDERARANRFQYE